MFFEYLAIALAGGLALDFMFGDPSNKYHPVAWLGRLIGTLVPKLKVQAGDKMASSSGFGPDSNLALGPNQNSLHALPGKTILPLQSMQKRERAAGIMFALGLVFLAGAAVHVAVASVILFAGVIVAIAFSALILKVTIAIKGMEKHALAITRSLEENDIAGASHSLSLIVRRDTQNLDEGHILSATVECVSESTVDGIISPLFYHSFFGPAGAFAYRVVNTLDSMVGYKDSYYKDIGWMSAKMDTAANYVPARIVAFLMVVSAGLAGADWRNSLRILNRDHDKTFSPNAGYPMSAMAGALRMRLEKVGHYSLGDSLEPASIEKCKVAIRIMKLTTILFCLVFSLPVMAVLYLAGWWNLLFGVF